MGLSAGLNCSVLFLLLCTHLSCVVCSTRPPCLEEENQRSDSLNNPSTPIGMKHSVSVTSLGYHSDSDASPSALGSFQDRRSTQIKGIIRRSQSTSSLGNWGVIDTPRSSSVNTDVSVTDDRNERKSQSSEESSRSNRLMTQPNKSPSDIDQDRPIDETHPSNEESNLSATDDSGRQRDTINPESNDPESSSDARSHKKDAWWKTVAIVLILGSAVIIPCVVSLYYLKFRHLSNEVDLANEMDVSEEVEITRRSKKNISNRKQIRFDGTGTARDHAMRPRSMRRRVSSSLSSTLAVVHESTNEENSLSNEEDETTMRRDETVASSSLICEFDTRDADAEQYRQQLVARLEEKDEPWHRFLSCDLDLIDADPTPRDTQSMDMDFNDDCHAPAAQLTPELGGFTGFQLKSGIHGNDDDLRGYQSEPDLCEMNQQQRHRHSSEASRPLSSVECISDYRPSPVDFLVTFKASDPGNLTKNEEYLLHRGFSF